MGMFSRLGPHSQFTSTKAAKWSACAPIVKQMDGFQYLKDAPNGAITIYRKFFADQNLNLHGWDIANTLLDDFHNSGYNPGAKGHHFYFEMFNERVSRYKRAEDCEGVLRDDDPNCEKWCPEFERYMQMEGECAARLHANGQKMIGGNFPVCWPRQDGWQRYCQNWRSVSTDQKVDRIGIHEYWGNGSNSVVNEKWALHHRQLHRWDSGHPPLIITECGRDYVDGELCKCNESDCGWLAQNQVSAPAYLLECKRLDQALAVDSGYVDGGVLFGAAPNMCDCHTGIGCFATYNMDGLVDDIVGATCAPPSGCQTPWECARDALCALDSSWCGANQQQVFQHVCFDDCTIFLNSSIRQNLCGTLQCPIPGNCLPCPRGHIDGCPDCPNPCTPCPRGHIDGCGDCPEEPPGGVSPLLILGAVVSLGLLGVIFAKYSQHQAQEVEEPYRFSDLRAIPVGQELPPGYFELEE